MKLSASLAAAARDEFVYVGRRGEIRSPARYRAQRAVGISLAALAAVVGVGLSFALSAPWLAGLYLAVSGYGAAAWWMSERLKQGAALVAVDRLDEAEANLRPLTTSRLASKTIRALAWQNLAGVAVRRGRHAEGLEHVRRCDALLATARLARSGPWRWINVFSEVQLLAQLGRVEEARELLPRLIRAPDGEYFQVLRMNAELMLAFATGAPDELPGDLHPWTRQALSTTTAELALVLLAWAHRERGDHDMADHLLHEARDRLEPSLFARIYPKVWRWLSAQRPAIASE